MTGLAERRARYARSVMPGASEAGRANPRVEAAFASVPREDYLTRPPWRIFAPGGLMDEETSDPAKLYADVLVALDRPKGINNGQPSLHAAWMAQTDPQPGETVVQIGIGAGYYTAILAELVGGGGRIEAYEIEPALAEVARRNLEALPQVAVHGASGTGRELPEADLVYVSAGAPAPDPHWLRALSPGGRLVMPWQPALGQGQTLVARRARAGFRAELSGHVSFVACTGLDDRSLRPRALPPRPQTETRSLWLTEDRAPDATATAVYTELWFSADPV